MGNPSGELDSKIFKKALDLIFEKSQKEINKIMNDCFSRGVGKGSSYFSKFIECKINEIEEISRQAFFIFYSRRLEILYNQRKYNKEKEALARKETLDQFEIYLKRIESEIEKELSENNVPNGFLAQFKNKAIKTKERLLVDLDICNEEMIQLFKGKNNTHLIIEWGIKCVITIFGLVAAIITIVQWQPIHQLIKNLMVFLKNLIF